MDFKALKKRGPRKNWQPFEEARMFVRTLGLKNSRDWNAYCKSPQKPTDIPSEPWKTYSEWQSLGDWLGTGTIANQRRKFLPFEEARLYIRSLELQNTDEWIAYCKSGQKPDDIPQDPSHFYGSSWQGMSDWLGSKGRAPVDLTGLRFGRLLVISYVDSDAHGRSRWNCLCDCGNSKIVSRRELLQRDTQSCGCLWREKRKLIVPNKKAFGESAFNQLFYSYKKSARERGYVFELNEEEFRNLTKSNCYYCGEPPSGVALGTKGTNGNYLYTGIDRIDSSIGYVSDNVRPCCKQCNFAKGTLTESAFYTWILKVASYTAARSARFEFGEKGR